MTWILTRHVVFIAICHSLNLHLGGDILPFGTYSLSQTPRNEAAEKISGRKISDNGGYEIWRHLTQPFFFPDAETVANNPRTKAVFFTLMLTLQGLLILWFALICRVIVNVLRGDGADDSRSDAEDDDVIEEAPAKTSQCK